MNYETNPKKYLERTWIDPRLEIGDSKIQGKGVFTASPIKTGEIVMVFGGLPFTQKQLDDGEAKEHTALQIDDDLFLALPTGTPAEESRDEYTNHTCLYPSCWLTDDVTLIARVDMQPGDEITMDYGTWYYELDEKGNGVGWITNCNCGSKGCRGQLTGTDWQRKDVQQAFKGHIAPFLQRKIDKHAE